MTMATAKVVTVFSPGGGGDCRGGEGGRVVAATSGDKSEVSNDGA